MGTSKRTAVHEAATRLLWWPVEQETGQQAEDPNAVERPLRHSCLHLNSLQNGNLWTCPRCGARCQDPFP